MYNVIRFEVLQGRKADNEYVVLMKKALKAANETLGLDGEQ